MSHASSPHACCLPCRAHPGHRQPGCASQACATFLLCCKCLPHALLVLRSWPGAARKRISQAQCTKVMSMRRLTHTRCLPRICLTQVLPSLCRAHAGHSQPGGAPARPARPPGPAAHLPRQQHLRLHAHGRWEPADAECRRHHRPGSRCHGRCGHGHGYPSPHRLRRWGHSCHSWWWRGQRGRQRQCRVQPCEAGALPCSGARRVNGAACAGPSGHHSARVDAGGSGAAAVCTAK